MGAEKCTFAAKEVSYLGHRVTEEGLLPDSSLLAAIQEIPPPKTATEVRSFFGLAGYYRRYVKNFAAIAGPLHTLTRKDAVFHWSPDCQTAFDRLKTLLTTSPITAFPDFSQVFRLYTDASTAGLGAILAQVRDGKERIICCASRSLNQAEKAYPATKLECLAIVWAVAKFRSYLMAMPFEVFTDQYALKWLKTMRTGSALLHRWRSTTSQSIIVQGRPRPTLMGSAGCQWTPRHLRTRFSMYMSSMIRHQLEEFCGRAPKRRKRYCYPGAKIDDITKALEDITAKEKHDSLYIVHVGTNDVKNTNSEELLEKYKRLIGTLKEKRSKFIVSGILPRIGAENQFYNKAFSTNDRLKSLCSKENVEFLNLWNHFYDQRILFNHDGLHLNPVGSARLGRLLSDAVEARRTKNGEQRGLVTLSQK